MQRTASRSPLDALPYAALWHGSLQGVLIVQANQVLLANPAAARLFGAAADALAGRPLADLLAPDGAERLESAGRRARGDSPQRCQVAGRTLAGEPLALELGVLPIAWGPAQAWQVTVLDRTGLAATQARLEARDAEFHHLIDGSLQGIYVHEDHRLLFVNRTFAEMFGYDSPEELLAVGDAMAVYAPGERERLEGFYRARIAGGQPPVRYEFEGLRKDGSTIWLENLVRVVTWQGRQAILATVIDISERKRAEQALLASEEKHRNLVEGSMQGILIQRGGRALFVNQALVALFGYDSPEEMYALTSMAALVAEDDHERMRAYAHARKLGEPAPERYLVHGVTKQGDELWVDTAVRPVNWEGAPAWQVTLVDVTERVRVERALREQQRLLETVLDTIPHSVYVKGTDLRYRMVNQAFARAFKRPVEEVIGRRREELWPDESPEAERIEQSDLAVLRQGVPQEIHDLSERMPDGTLARRHLIKYPLLGENGEVTGIVGITENITERMAAEEGLRASERLMRLVFDHLPYLVFVKDTAGHYRLVNAAFEAFHGIRSEHILGRRAEDLPLGDPRDRELFLESDRQVLESGRLVNLPEVPLTPVGGERGVYHVQKLPLTDEAGAIIGLVGLSEDITARIRAQQELRDSQRLLRAVIDTLPHSIYVRDREGRYRIVNRAMAEYHGRSPKELLGKTTRDFPRPWTPELEMLAETDAQVVREGRTLEIPDVTLTDARGQSTVRRIVKIPLPDDHGNVTGIVGISEDITERKRAEEELRASRVLLQSVINLLPLWVFVKDTRRRFVMINRQMAEDYALTGEVEPGALIDLAGSITEEERSVIYDLDQRVLDTGELVEMPQVQITLPGGETRLFRTVRMPLRDAGGALAGIVGIAEDITERVRTEQAIQQAQKLESLGVLAGGIAHDFNNLLVSIMGNASLAMLDLPADSPAHGPIVQIETAGQRAAELCRQMLAYSGKGSFEIALVNLNALIEEMTQLLRVSLAKPITLTYAFDSGLPGVEVDATQIRQVVMNLVMNAAEAIGEQPGAITLVTRAVQADAALLRTYIQGEELPPGRYVCLEVKDTGQGIAPEMVGRIFDPFFTTKFAGRGLGLAAVLGIVRGHGGAMQVVSQAGAGTVFRMLLPARDDAAHPARGDASGAAWHGEGTVLVVDDQEDVRQVVERMVASLGFTVVAAATGAEALERMRELGDALRVVLLDVTMPDLDGGETLRRVRAERADLPVVLLSGYSEHDVQNRFEGLDANGFLQKPFTRRTLATKLEALLG